MRISVALSCSRRVSISTRPFEESVPMDPPLQSSLNWATPMRFSPKAEDKPSFDLPNVTHLTKYYRFI
jgi:hypothetical protein